MFHAHAATSTILYLLKHKIHMNFKERVLLAPFYFVPDLVTKATMRPLIIAAVIPAEPEESGPVTIPSQPVSFIISRVPLANVYPKPVRGTVAPQPAKLTRWLYKPTASRITPRTTKLTSIRAGVSFVRSIKS